MTANGNILIGDDGQPLGTFSSHWAACAAMLRMSDPTFASLGGDSAEDLAEEALMAARQPLAPSQSGTTRRQRMRRS